MDLNTYLTFNGQCDEALRFYARVLGGRVVMMLRYAQAPTGAPVEAGTDHLVMHGRIEVDGRFIMGSDAPPDRYSPPQGHMTNISVDDPVEAERIFKDLSEGGAIVMPIAETFWARRFAMFKDRYGIDWMINCEKAEPAAGSRVEPFRISRTFHVPRHVLWRALTDVGEMRKWWGPKGVRIFAATMDLRPGGKFVYGMRTPDGNDMWGRMVFCEIAPMHRLVFINAFSDESGGLTRHPLAPQWPLQLLSTFDLIEQGDRTTFAVTWIPLDPTPEERAAFEAGHDSMRMGWGGTLDNLERYLQRQ